VEEKEKHISANLYRLAWGWLILAACIIGLYLIVIALENHEGDKEEAPEVEHVPVKEETEA